MTTHYDRNTLIDYLHRELAPGADAAVFEHLGQCAACRTLHNEEASVGEALRSYVRADEFELPSLVKARVWETIRNQRPSWKQRLRAWGPTIAVPVAAVIALAAYMGTPVLHPQQNAAGIAAAYYLDEHNAEAQQNPLGPGAAPAVYTTSSVDRGTSPAASYIDTADAATLDDAAGAGS